MASASSLAAAMPATRPRRSASGWRTTS